MDQSKHTTEKKEKALNISASMKPAFFSQSELNNIKEKTNQLKKELENNNVDEALKKINDNIQFV